MEKKIKKIGVLTSGGDAPGMNAALRAVVRTALSHGVEVVGFYGGFRGILEKDFEPLTVRAVANTLKQGGTILQTSRFPEFKDRKVRKQALEHLEMWGIDALVVIGGNGSYMGASFLAKESRGKLKVIGIPGTIDNDINGTDFTIGFSTALGTITEYVDKIRDTASSHNRVFVLQVMGRHCKDLAEAAGLTCGAEWILIPDCPYDLDEIATEIKNNASLPRNMRKTHNLLLVAEGINMPEEERANGAAMYIADGLRKRGVECHSDDVGYAQRGGSPSPEDRILATRMGAFAIEELLAGKNNKAISMRNGELTSQITLSQACNSRSNSNTSLLDLAYKLSHG